MKYLFTTLPTASMLSIELNVNVTFIPVIDSDNPIHKMFVMFLINSAMTFFLTTCSRVGNNYLLNSYRNSLIELN